MSISTLYSQDLKSLIEPKAFKYKISGVEYVLFNPEDYRDILALEREYEIALHVQDSLEFKIGKLAQEVEMYIMEVDDFQRITEGLSVQIEDLKLEFKEYSSDTENKLAKAIKKKNTWRSIAAGAVAVVIVETVLILLIAR